MVSQESSIRSGSSSISAPTPQTTGVGIRSAQAYTGILQPRTIIRSSRIFLNYVHPQPKALKLGSGNRGSGLKNIWRGRAGEQNRWRNSIGTHTSVELPDEEGEVYFELAVCSRGRTTPSPETMDTRAG
jgi:hypothetical protein